VRTFIVKTNTDLKSLSADLIDSRFSDKQKAAALQEIRTLNPHVDIDKLKAGSALFLPSKPGFKAAAAKSPQSDMLDEFQRLLSSALSDTAGRLRDGSVARAAERAAVRESLGTPGFKAALREDPDLAKQAESAQKFMAAEEAAEKQQDPEEAVKAMGKAAMASIAVMSKLLG
jgi:hypothetical protein